MKEEKFYFWLNWCGSEYDDCYVAMTRADCLDEDEIKNKKLKETERELLTFDELKALLKEHPGIVMNKEYFELHHYEPDEMALKEEIISLCR